MLCSRKPPTPETSTSNKHPKQSPTPPPSVVLRLSPQRRRWQHTCPLKPLRGYEYMLIKLYDIVSRILLLTLACLLTKPAKLRTTCWAMAWLAKKAIHEPIILEQISQLGTLSLRVTSTSAHVSWCLPSNDACSAACGQQSEETMETQAESGRGASTSV